MNLTIIISFCPIAMKEEKKYIFKMDYQEQG